MNQIGRRAFVTGAMGSAAVASGLSWNSSSRAGGSATTPRRFVFVLTGNGFDGSILWSNEARQWIEKTRGSAFPTSRWWNESYGSQLVQPQSVVSDLSVAPGLDTFGELGLVDRTAVVLGLSSRVTGGGHSALHGVLSSARSRKGSPGGPTIDALLASIPEVRGEGELRTPYDALRIGIHAKVGRSITYATCALGRGAPLPMMFDAQSVWDVLFGPLASEDGQEALATRTRLLEHAQLATDASLAALEGPAGAQALVQQYGGAVEDRLASQARLDEIRQRVQSEGIALPERPAATAALSPLERLDVQLEHAATALQLGLTNVMVVGMGCGDGFAFRYGIDSLSESADRHNLSHMFLSSGDARATLREAWRRELSAVARFASRLDGTPDPVAGSGSLLDNTTIVFIGDNGEYHHASGREFPLLLVGGQQMGLQTGGRTYLYPDLTHGGAEHRQISNLWNTFGGYLSGSDTPLDDFGEDAGRIATGPLPELIS